MKQRTGGLALLILATILCLPLFNSATVLAEEADVEVTIVEPVIESEEEPTPAVPNTGTLTILGKEFSRQDLTTLSVATIMIIACGITAIFSYKTHKRGGQNE